MMLFIIVMVNPLPIGKQSIKHNTFPKNWLDWGNLATLPFLSWAATHWQGSELQPLGGPCG